MLTMEKIEGGFDVVPGVTAVRLDGQLLGWFREDEDTGEIHWREAIVRDIWGREVGR